MGPQAAVNAVYYNQLQAIEDPEARAARVAELREAYAADIDILHLASELVIDAVIQPEELRRELIQPLRPGRRAPARLAGQAHPDHAGLARRFQGWAPAERVARWPSISSTSMSASCTTRPSALPSM